MTGATAPTSLAQNPADCWHNLLQPALAEAAEFSQRVL